jgi:hypothetical protein
MNSFDDNSSWSERFSKSFGENQGGDAFLIALLVILGLVLLLLFIRRVVQEIFVDREGRRVFNELCRAHKLTRKERRLIAAYAQNFSLRNRAAVFVRPSLFRDSAQRAEGVKGIARKLNLNVEALGALDAGLQEKLFGEYPSDGTLHRQTDKVYQEQAQ